MAPGGPRVVPHTARSRFQRQPLHKTVDFAESPVSRVRKILIGLVLLGLAGLAGFWILTAPLTWEILHARRDSPSDKAANLDNGRAMFLAAGCATCHATPGQSDETKLGGGGALPSDFGIFFMPNVSPDPDDGIGRWSEQQFITAMREGVLPDGRHAYPAYPYTSYQRMTADDLKDLFAYLKTLPPVKGKVRDNDLPFPFSMRRGIGMWKLVFLDGQPLTPDPSKGDAWNRGRYLVEGPMHCAECHSPRNAAGVIPSGMRFAGGPDPEGSGGWLPNLTNDGTGLASWTEADLSQYLLTGKSPHGTTAGGSMGPVVRNAARLTQADRDAIATYVKSLAPIKNAPGASVAQAKTGAKISASSRVLAALVQDGGAEAATSDRLFTTTTISLYLDRPADSANAGPGAGKVLPATALKVIARDGNWLHVTIEGWQQAGAERAIFALQGKRIITAAITPDTAGKLQQKSTFEDPDTGLTWHQVELTAWVENKGMLPNVQNLWVYGSDLYGRTCGTCHAAKASTDYLANQWPGTVGAMRRFTSLDDEQVRFLEKYLQFHAKDVSQSDPQVTQ